MRRKFFLLIFTAIFAFADEPVKMVVELSRDSVKVMGQARGLLSDVEILKERAIAAAKGEADVLINTDFFYEEDGDSIDVTVTGFPARFRNLRQKTQVYDNIVNFNVGLPSGKNNFTLDLPSSDVKTGKGFYFSAKAQFLIHAYYEYWKSEAMEFGFNLSFGGFTRHLLIAGDIGLIFGTYGYPVGLDHFASFGYRGQPTEWFQIVSGISLGAGFSDGYISLGGVFVKTLFGKNKTWFEISHRWHFVYFNTHQIMFGFTYAPSKK